MNINLMAQALAVEITQSVQTTLPGDSGAQGTEFEDMLVKQSQAAKPQRKEETAQDKTNKKQTEKDTQEAGTKEQETTEGQEVAAALVTSQPVVPLDLELAGGEKMTVSGLEGPVLDSELAGVITWVDGTPLTEERVLPQAAQEILPQTGEDVQNLPVQEEMPTQQPTGQTESQTVVLEAAPELPQSQAEFQVQERDTVPGQELPVQAEGGKPEEDGEIQEVHAEAQPLFRQNVATPTKVGEVYEAREPQNIHVVNQLNTQIIQAIQQGQSTVQVQLSPANLGKVLVEITRSGDGTISIVMSAATEKTAALLQQHSAGLQEVLMNATQERVEVQVQQPQEQQNANMFLNPDGHNQQRDPQKQKEQEQKQQNNPADFLQQLRLGLVELDGVGK